MTMMMIDVRVNMFVCVLYLMWNKCVNFYTYAQETQPHFTCLVRFHSNSFFTTFIEMQQQEKYNSTAIDAFKGRMWKLSIEQRREKYIITWNSDIVKEYKQN